MEFFCKNVSSSSEWMQRSRVYVGIQGALYKASSRPGESIAAYGKNKSSKKKPLVRSSYTQLFQPPNQMWSYYKIGNGIQVTICNEGALGSWNLDCILIGPIMLSNIVFSCLEQVSRELLERKKTHYYTGCDSKGITKTKIVTMFTSNKGHGNCVDIYSIGSNMKGRTNIICWGQQVSILPSVLVLFWAFPRKNAFKTASVEQCNLATFHQA